MISHFLGIMITLPCSFVKHHEQEFLLSCILVIFVGLYVNVYRFTFSDGLINYRAYSFKIWSRVEEMMVLIRYKQGMLIRLEREGLFGISE